MGHKETIYRRVLEIAGYGHEEPTEESVRECFRDYVAAGYWRDLNLEDVQEITTLEICQAFCKMKGLRLSELTPPQLQL